MQFDLKQGIYLAALLHDIGKFWQRGVPNKNVLSASTKNIIDSICPTNKESGSHTHIHALFTSEFFDTYSHIFPGQLSAGDDTIELGNLSARHHKYNLNKYERIIQYADRLSSGQDRRSSVTEEDEEQNYSYKKVPLLNPFDVVYDIKPKSERTYFEICKLENDERIFGKKADLTTSKQPDYEQLWSAFTDESEHLPRGSFSALTDTLLMLLRKYTWAIPSSTIDMPDISLYDHLKTTAAIADVLFQSQQNEKLGALPDSFDGLKSEPKNRFVLLAGDFSGIQKFIYQLSSKGAAKTLKGRSYYLNLVQDYVITTIKDLFDGYDAHILMSSGGRFQILLPNDSQKLEKLREFICEVNLHLRHEYGDVIYLALGHHTFPASTLLKDNGYSNVVKAAYQQVERDKKRKFASVIDAAFFEPKGVGGTKSSQICHVTGKELEEHETTTLGDDEDTVISTYVNAQIKLGRWLKNAKYMVKIRK